MLSLPYNSVVFFSNYLKFLLFYLFFIFNNRSNLKLYSHLSQPGNDYQILIDINMQMERHTSIKSLKKEAAIGPFFL